MQSTSLPKKTGINDLPNELLIEVFIQELQLFNHYMYCTGMKDHQWYLGWLNSHKASKRVYEAAKAAYWQLYRAQAWYDACDAKKEDGWTTWCAGLWTDPLMVLDCQEISVHITFATAMDPELLLHRVEERVTEILQVGSKICRVNLFLGMFDGIAPPNAVERIVRLLQSIESKIGRRLKMDVINDLRYREEDSTAALA